MRKGIVLSFHVLWVVVLLLVTSGCGSSNKEGGPSVTQTDLVNAIKLGDLNCLQCHNAGKDLTMVNDLDTRTIGAVWQDSLHNGDINGIVTVHCEDCHGGGQFHWGVGPLAFPVPDYKVCSNCHSGATAADLGLNDKSSFVATAHANTAQIPDKFFFQGDAGTGQATFTRFYGANRVDTPEVTPAGTPVTKAQHIEECSVCHNSNWRFIYDNATPPNLLHPDPTNMPTPSASCANCHDAHQTGLTANVPLRPDGSTNVDYQIFRKVQVNANGANDPIAGTWIRPILFWNHSTMSTQTLNGNFVDANGKRELNIENLCASCHTVGKYKFNNFSTHQTNVFTQWTNSAHGSRNEAAWALFSANPPAYTNPDTGLPYTDLSESTKYPYDVSNEASTRWLCKKCHNGVSSIDWQMNVQGTPDARVVWGDEPATCVTCHDTHPRTDLGVTINASNIRKPVVMTNYSSTIKNGTTVVGSLKFSGDVFLDKTAVPATALSATSVICIFCHQGRESGFTLFKEKLSPPAGITGSFFNNHYLGTAAMLWAVNGYEYPQNLPGGAQRLYGANVAHQGANCAICHMSNPTPDNLAGGHTWERNVATCNTSACHGASFLGPIPAAADGVTPDLSTYRATFDTNNYSGDTGGTTQGIADSIRSLQQQLITLLAAQTPPIFYTDLIYPYFFADPTFTTPFTAWTPATLKAAFNLSFVIKGLPSSPTSQANVPNGSAAAHDFIYCIQLLQDSYENLNGGIPIANATRPAGTRPATNYNPQAGGGYDPLQ
jgi:hypothetical protein